MSRARTLSLLAVLAAAGCNNNNNSPVSFAFERPEQVEFACLGQFANVLTTPAAKIGTWTTLPLDCCTLYDASSFDVDAPLVPLRDPVANPYPDEPYAHAYCSTQEGFPLNTPTLHALVTQTARGEVGAVDLVANRVLDSDRQIPGFTFIDSGGLPTAIVVPKSQPKGPLADPLPGVPAAPRQGPTWLYVTSAEQNAVRAIPICRFRNGAACGPDLAQGNAGDDSYVSRLRVPLPSAPADMILGPDEALWVTLPELGQIWRIALPEAGNVNDAFALDPVTRQPLLAQAFGVPPVQDDDLAEPIVESVDYRTSCGLGVAYAPTSFTLPIAPRALVQSTPEPGRLVYDAESNLLFVTDRASPGLHVFRPGLDGSLTAIGSIPTGQPLREFVITPRVPSTAVSGVGLLAYTTPPEDRNAETKRYLYGIDSLGTVAVFDFVDDDLGELPTLTPLLVPVPDITLNRYADRLGLPTTAMPSQALAVIDTRSQSDYTCGEESIDLLRTRQTELRAIKPPTARDLRELSRVQARISVHDTAQDGVTPYMRGVFVALISTQGRLGLIDVHDLDTSCRAQKFCCAGTGAVNGVNNGVPTACSDDASGAALNVPRSADSNNSMSVRRHTLHRGTAGQQTVQIASSNLLAAQSCDPSDAHASVQLAAQICTPADVYTQLSDAWRIDSQGPLPNSATDYARWAPGTNAGQLTLIAPGSFDLCALGVEVGDFVAVRGRAPEALRATCPDPSSDTAPLFKILEARTDRLLVEPYLRPLATNETADQKLARENAQKATQLQKALECYPDYVGVELRAGTFLVTGASAASYLHRITTGLDGSCITDTTKDELLNSRVRRGTIRVSAPTAENPVAVNLVDADVFRSPYVSFALAPAASDAVLPETRETSVAVSRASVPFFLDTVTQNDQVTQALPSSLYYLPQIAGFFVLDTSGQGLRRYTLRPFQRDTTVFR